MKKTERRSMLVEEDSKWLLGLPRSRMMAKAEDPMLKVLEARVLKLFGVEKTDEDGRFFTLEKIGSRPMEEILHFPGFGWRFTSPEAMLEAVSGAELYNYLSLLVGRQVGKSGWHELALPPVKKNPLHGFFRGGIEGAMMHLDLLGEEGGNANA